MSKKKSKVTQAELEHLHRRIDRSKKRQERNSYWIRAAWAFGVFNAGGFFWVTVSAFLYALAQGFL